MTKAKRIVAIKNEEHMIDVRNLHRFFWWMAERDNIRLLQARGSPPPWTTDSVLQKHKFCNVFRVFDRGTQYLIENVIDTGDPDPAETVFRVMVFRLFNKPETWLMLLNSCGVPTLKTFNFAENLRILEHAYNAKTKLYTSAYIIPSPKISPGEPAFKNHLILLERIRDDNIPRKLVECKTLFDAYTLLHTLPGIGNFIAYQLVLDFNMINGIDWSENEFAAFGPGSRQGLNHIFCDGVSSSQISGAMEYLYSTQLEHWNDIGIIALPSRGDSKAPPGVSLPDIEHSLCEFAKYLRLQASPNASRSGEYRPNDAPPTYIFPSKWKGLTKDVPESTAAAPMNFPSSVCPDTDSEEESDTYEVSHIVSQRVARKGRQKKNRITQYKVRWVGYSSEDDTWLDENAFENAKDVLADWKYNL